MDTQAFFAMPFEEFCEKLEAEESLNERGGAHLLYRLLDGLRKSKEDQNDAIKKVAHLLNKKLVDPNNDNYLHRAVQLVPALAQTITKLLIDAGANVNAREGYGGAVKNFSMATP